MLRASRAAIDVLVEPIDKALLAEETLQLGARSYRLWQGCGDPRFVAGRDLRAVEVTSIGMSIFIIVFGFAEPTRVD